MVDEPAAEAAAEQQAVGYFPSVDGFSAGGAESVGAVVPLLAGGAADSPAGGAVDSGVAGFVASLAGAPLSLVESAGLVPTGALLVGSALPAAPSRSLWWAGLDQYAAATQTAIQIPAVTMVIRVKTSPAFAPNALEPPMPPRAPVRPPPRPRCTRMSRIKKIDRMVRSVANNPLMVCHTRSKLTTKCYCGAICF
jgi:hypothetical protein